MTHSSRDPRLDLWVETKLLRRSRQKRFAIPAYTTYPNRALLTLSDLEMPFTLQRRSDLKYEVAAFGHKELADDWEDVALAVCLLLFRTVEGKPWPHQAESSDAEKNI